MNRIEYIGTGARLCLKDQPQHVVAVLALRELRPRSSGRNEQPQSIARPKALRRCTRRYCSQRE